VVVETDLAHRARGWRRRPLLAHDGRGPIGIRGVLMRLMRVNPYRKRSSGQSVEAKRLRGFLGISRFENDHRPFQPGIAGATDNVVEIRRERLVREVAMTVDHIGRFRRSAISFRLSAATRADS
jgi:hypothetical protein